MRTGAWEEPHLRATILHMRTSAVTVYTDAAGYYEVEVFDYAEPRSVVICSHGNGVRRWDGEHFFYAVAEHYPDRAFLLVDQNQPYQNGCKLNGLDVMVARVQSLIDIAQRDYPGNPIIVMGHSMGCGVAAELDLSAVEKVIFVAPSAGDQSAKLFKRYGEDIADGKVVTSSDGLTKYVTKKFYDSVQGIVWEDEYKKLLAHYSSVHAFESGDESIVGEERLVHRTMPFAGYKIIPGAKHNYTGKPLQLLFAELDSLL